MEDRNLEFRLDSVDQILNLEIRDQINHDHKSALYVYFPKQYKDW